MRKTIVLCGWLCATMYGLWGQSLGNQAPLLPGIYFQPATGIFTYRSLVNPALPSEMGIHAAIPHPLPAMPASHTQKGKGVAQTLVDERGSRLTIDSTEASVQIAGRLYLPTQFGKSQTHMQLAGEWKQGGRISSLQTQLVGRFQFPALPPKAWEFAYYKGAMTSFANASLDGSDPVLLKALAEFTDPDYRKPAKNMQHLREQMAASISMNQLHAGQFVPSDLLLAQINFHYDAPLRTLWASGPIGLLAIGGLDCHTFTNSNSKIRYALGQNVPDTLQIYLEFDEFNWLYISQAGEQLYTISSDIDGYNAYLRKHLAYNRRYVMLKEEDKDLFLVRFIHHFIWRTGRSTDDRS